MRHVKAISVLVLFAVLGSMQWIAQAAPLPQATTPQAPGQQAEQAALVAQLAQASNGEVRVSYHAQTGNVRFIGTDGQQPIARAAGIAGTASGEQAARAFLA